MQRGKPTLKTIIGVILDNIRGVISSSEALGSEKSALQHHTT